MNDQYFEFAHPWVLWFLILVPLIVWLQSGRRELPVIRFSSLSSLRPLGDVQRSGRWGLQFTFLLLAVTLFILALARPRLGKGLDHVQASGVDIVLTLDVSGSMAARDFTLGGQKADRLEVVKDVTRNFIKQRRSDRMGIVCFAGRPYLVSPLTLDHEWLFTNLERVQMGLVEDGTAIGSAIASSSNRLKDNPGKTKIIVLLTDGEETVATVAPTTAAEAAAKLGIKIYTIAVGTLGQAESPVGRDFLGRTVYRMVDVKVDEETLKKVAQIGGGEFYRATDTASLTGIFAKIDKLEKTEVKLEHYTRWLELFAWFIGAGLFCAVLHLLLHNTVWRTLP